jgi:hypothetical protein
LVILQFCGTFATNAEISHPQETQIFHEKSTSVAKRIRMLSELNGSQCFEKLMHCDVVLVFLSRGQKKTSRR